MIYLQSVGVGLAAAVLSICLAVLGSFAWAQIEIEMSAGGIGAVSYGGATSDGVVSVLMGVLAGVLWFRRARARDGRS
jgi:hypothetical protein